jgi:hypothetical protein
VRLLPVTIETARDGADGGGVANGKVAWELEAPSGHVLRVFEQHANRALDEVLFAVFGRRGGDG